MKIKPVDKELRKKYQGEIGLITKVVPQLETILNLETWRIDVSIKENDGKPEPDEYGNCTAEAEYKEAEITYYVGTMAELQDDYEQLDTVIHEMLHIYLSPITTPLRKVMTKEGRRLATYEEECLVSMLAANLALWRDIKL